MPARFRTVLSNAAKSLFGGGRARAPITRRPALGVTRLEEREVPAGLLDTTFSGDGKAQTAFDLGGSNNDRATAVAVDSAGRTVVAGSAQLNATGDYDFAVTRYLSNGNLDTTFSGDGKVTIPFDLGGGLEDKATSITIDSAGRIVVAGYAQLNATGDFDFAVARLLSNGALDTTFSGDGKRTVPFDLGGGKNDRASGVKVDSAGRIVLGGYTQRNTTGDYDFAVARLTSTGTLDSTFNGNGKRVIYFDYGGTKDDRAAGVAIDSANRVVLGGYTARATAGDYDFAVVRLTATGAMDTSFSGDGKLAIYFDLGGSKNDRATAVAVDSSNRVVLGGYAQRSSSDYDFAAVRLTTAGTPDASFSGDGKVVIAFDLGGGNYDIATALRIDSLGRILLGGTVSRATSGDYDFAVVRLTSSGALDTTFSGDGRATVAFDLGGAKGDFLSGIAVDSSNRVYVAGYVARNSTGDYDFGVARLT